ncbi:MAG: DUF1800 domain-containing protein [Chitinophagaceae bacterium]|nr:DUF1800 domain-containing protein [Chitinophagaceae bacterium]
MPDQSRKYSLPALDKNDWNRDQLVHLLKRTMFGVKQSDLAFFKNASMQEAVDKLLHPGTFNYPPPVNDYDAFGITVAPGQTWVNMPYLETESEEGGRLRSFQRWSIGLLIHQDLSIREKMVLFWHNHFATQTTISHSNFLWKHFSMLRANALGNFRNLVKEITLDCHMLRYLNGEKNTRLAPNENYGRELQELFCIGKMIHPGYTEDDVKQVARVLTGWTVNYEKGIAVFNEADHDNSDKIFSSFYGHAVIHGHNGPDAGEQELEQLLDIIFANPETARFICRKLYRWFVHYHISEETEQQVIRPLAQVLADNHFDILPVLKSLFESAHFYSDAVKGAQVKSPLDFYIGLQRELDVQFPRNEEYTINYSMWKLLLEHCEQMGQVYGNPPNVSGWPAYYQAPLFYKLWINSSTYPKRNEFSATLVDFGFNREGVQISADMTRFASQFAQPGNPEQLIRDILEILYRVKISDTSVIAVKKNTLLSGQTADHYWTTAWNEWKNDPGNSIKKNEVESRLKQLVRFIIQSPEFHLM